MIVLGGGCKPQEPSKLTIVVEGKELSDAEIFIDGKPAGLLTQTIITEDGKIYIDGMLSAKLPPQHHGERETYSGCAGSIVLKSGEHTITLRKSEVQPLQVVVNISPGHHLLTFLPEKALVKWDNTSFQIEPGKTVTIVSENIK
jgi:hypothetical protein